MEIALVTVPAALTSSIPAVMLPAPSAVKLPTRDNGTGENPPVKDSPLVTNAYWPFRLALLKFPTGGGSVMVSPPPPHAAIQKAAASANAEKRRFIAHLAARPLERAKCLRQFSSKTL